MKQPTKAIICAAGLGTRFLPQTKAMPKEMLPIIDKPIIQYLVEECQEAGLEEVIIVVSPAEVSKFEDYFNKEFIELNDNKIASFPIITKVVVAWLIFVVNPAFTLEISSVLISFDEKSLNEKSKSLYLFQASNKNL